MAEKKKLCEWTCQESTSKNQLGRTYLFDEPLPDLLVVEGKGVHEWLGSIPIVNYHLREGDYGVLESKLFLIFYKIFISFTSGCLWP